MNEMNAFLVLIGQLFLIVCIQSVLEMFFASREYLKTILTIAAYAASLYLLLRFVFDNLISEMFTLFTTTFQ